MLRPMSRTLQITLITLACIALYIGWRSLPVEKCQFLHYGDYVNSEGVIEGCGYEETEFFDMSKIRFPVIAELTPIGDPELGRPLSCTLTLFTTTGKPIKWEEIAVSHTERIHAMVVDQSLQDYQHVHPQPAGPAGYYMLEVIPQRPGPYTVYLDFIPLITSRRTLVATGFSVPGEPERPEPASRLEYLTGNFQMNWIPDHKELIAGQDLTFRLEVKTRDGSPTRFEPVMDSYAHVVAFDEADTGFAHMHPRNPFVEGQDPLHPDLHFTFRFEEPGYYRVWAQFIVNGEHLFAPFDLIVKNEHA